MKIVYTLLVVLFFCACNKTTFYVVRHGEKEAAAPNMTSDVPLSAAGKERAMALKDKLSGKGISSIYSTNTIRTKTTASPFSEAENVMINVYDPRDSTFVTKLKEHSKGKVLIVGHSNTVDDIVNQFLGKKTLSDLPDSQYGDLFIIRKKGKSFRYIKDHFGK